MHENSGTWSSATPLDELTALLQTHRWREGLAAPSHGCPFLNSYGRSLPSGPYILSPQFPGQIDVSTPCMVLLQEGHCCILLSKFCLTHLQGTVHKHGVQ